MSTAIPKIIQQFKIPVEQLEKITLALLHMEIQDYALCENEGSPKSNLCDADGFPLAQEFILEISEASDEQLQSLRALGFAHEEKEIAPYADTKNTEIPIGPFMINPARIRIYLEGAMAFGTGHHQTTKLCAIGLEIIKNESITSILDLGSGTGILGIAAAKYFKEASTIHASDVDPIAVETTRHNFALNEIKAQTFLSDGFQSIPGASYDLILANILLNPLCNMASEIIKRTKKYVILSGIIDTQKSELREAFHALTVHTELQLDEWCMLILQKSDV